MGLVGPLAAVVAGGLFWLLLHGGAQSSISMRGYAEQIDHPIAPVRAGRLSGVTVRLGQPVRAGDLVATMDPRELELGRQTARLELARARAELAAQEVIAQASVSRSELQALRLQTTQSRDRAQLTEVNQQVARLEKLADVQLVQATDLERSRMRQADLSASVAVLDAAVKQKQAGLGRPARGTLTADQVARLLEPYREATRLREVSVAAAELALAEGGLRAAAAGTVSAVLHQPGEVIAAGTEVVRVASARPGFIVCWVPERFAAKVVPGRVARVLPPGLLERGFPALVSEVSPQIEEVPARARVTSSVPGWGRRVVLESSPDRPLILGEAVNVRF
jgi:HlyD family secretion protein